MLWNLVLLAKNLYVICLRSGGILGIIVSFIYSSLLIFRPFAHDMAFNEQKRIVDVLEERQHIRDEIPACHPSKQQLFRRDRLLLFKKLSRE